MYIQFSMHHSHIYCEIIIKHFQPIELLESDLDKMKAMLKGKRTVE